ncbi:shikimate kinase [Acidobacteria bacterium AH-259-G07]|nr:shikimate kinase [Acidobacteria bacterium AH-259-G07]
MVRTLLKVGKHVYLVGFMGSGKSTIGPLLAREMDRPFYDLDELIEQERKMRISEIFESKGEPFFRELESHILVQSQHLTTCVMALGGGAFVSEFNREFMLKHGISVWLKIPLQLAKERCKNLPHRPLAKDPEQFESLFHLREMYYRLADIHIEVQWKSPEAICAEIEDKLTALL